LNTYSSFGYGLSRYEDLETLMAWQRVLRPGGCLIMEVVDIERVKFVFGDSTRVVRGDGHRVPREDLQMDWDQQLLFVRYTMDSWTWSGFTRFYTSEQLREMLTQAGFARVTFSGAFDGVAPKRPEDWAVATCWK
jgi:ubiquinone/menaquinone biosynthesis C-methylase UbiE